MALKGIKLLDSQELWSRSRTALNQEEKWDLHASFNLFKTSNLQQSSEVEAGASDSL